MRFTMGGRGPGRINIPEALFAMGFGSRGGWGKEWSWDADWGPGPGGPGGPGGHGRRGRRRMFEPGELRLVLLKLIAEQPRHGYDLIRAIEEMTHGSYAPSPGVVYPTLTMLQDMGLIEETRSEGEGSSRKAFAATADGHAHLAGREAEIEALMSRLEDLGHGPRKASGAPIKRAVGNLLSALWHRVTRDGVTEETLHEIAAILDEAAQKIERLRGESHDRPDEPDTSE